MGNRPENCLHFSTALPAICLRVVNNDLPGPIEEDGRAPRRSQDEIHSGLREAWALLRSLMYRGVLLREQTWILVAKLSISEIFQPTPLCRDRLATNIRRGGPRSRRISLGIQTRKGKAWRCTRLGEDVSVSRLREAAAVIHTAFLNKRLFRGPRTVDNVLCIAVVGTAPISGYIAESWLHSQWTQQ